MIPSDHPTPRLDSLLTIALTEVEFTKIFDVIEILRCERNCLFVCRNGIIHPFMTCVNLGEGEVRSCAIWIAINHPLIGRFHSVFVL